MNTLLTTNNVTEKDRENYIKIQVQRIILLPFSPKIYAEARFWVEKLHGDTKKEFMTKIKEWFYGHRGFNGEGIEDDDSISNEREREGKIPEEACKIN